MKNKLIHMLSAMVLSTCAITTSCSSADEPTTEPGLNDEGKTYEVSLSLGGEYTNVTETPLGRADEAPKKYYAVNVYCMKTDGSETDYSHYAYGVFDNVPAMKITLLGGYKYKFECTSVADDTDKITFGWYYDENDCLYEPFRTYQRYSDGSPFFICDLNKFITSQDKYLIDIKYGNTGIYKNGSLITYRYPRLDRFYGELDEFIPTDSSSANIQMKRTVFGIKVVVNGVPDGKLEWSTTQNPNAYSWALKFNNDNCTGPDKLEFSHIYTFGEVYECWKSEEIYTTDFTIYFTWTRGNGYKQYFEESITVKRNVMTTITVNLKGGANDVNIGVIEEATPMETEDITVDYDGGNLNDTPVTPDEQQQ